MTLQELARQKLEAGETLYNAGWHNGEWTCAECGTGIGKNLNGEQPFYLARVHAEKHTIEKIWG